jgi:hypothetical protein
VGGLACPAGHPIDKRKDGAAVEFHTSHVVNGIILGKCHGSTEACSQPWFIMINKGNHPQMNPNGRTIQVNVKVNIVKFTQIITIMAEFMVINWSLFHGL